MYYVLWSCGTWPRKLFEQTLRLRNATWDVSLHDYPPRGSMSATFDINCEEERRHFATILIKNDIKFQLATAAQELATNGFLHKYDSWGYVGDFVDNPPHEFFYCDGVAARKRFGQLKVVSSREKEAEK